MPPRLGSPRVGAGTCVNNEYVIQFKKGVFELGVPVNPVAIKYNKVRRGAARPFGHRERHGLGV
jgi:hypothetical protein